VVHHPRKELKIQAAIQEKNGKNPDTINL